MSRTYVPVEIRRRVTAQGRHRCAYCLTQEAIIGEPMEVDHITPTADGGETIEGNLCLACSLCNDHKNARLAAVDPETNELVRLFNPRTQRWAEHFRWSDGCDEIVGLTPTGRATVWALHVNRPSLVGARRLWVSVGWHPPKDEADSGG